MKAIISGQAGIALLIDDDQCWSVSAEEPDRRTPCRQEEAHYLFAGAEDVCVLESTTDEEARRQLTLNWHRDRSLQMALIALDREEDYETRVMAAECLEERFRVEGTAERILDRLCESPLPIQADLDSALNIARAIRLNRMLEVLAELEQLQPTVRAVCGAFDDSSVAYLQHPNFPNRGFVRRW